MKPISWKSWTTAELAKLKKLYELGVPMRVMERELHPRTRKAIRNAAVRFDIKRSLYGADKWMNIVRAHRRAALSLRGKA